MFKKGFQEFLFGTILIQSTSSFSWYLSVLASVINMEKKETGVSENLLLVSFLCHSVLYKTTLWGNIPVF